MYRFGVVSETVGWVELHFASDDGLLHVEVALVTDEIDDAGQFVVDDVLVVLHPR